MLDLSADSNADLKLFNKFGMKSITLGIEIPPDSAISYSSVIRARTSGLMTVPDLIEPIPIPWLITLTWDGIERSSSK